MNILPERNTPRLLVFIIDLFVCLTGLFLAFQLRFEFNIPANQYDSLKLGIPAYIVIRSFTFLFFRSYANIIRYTSTRDTQRILLVVFTGSAIISLGSLISVKITESYILPYSIVIMDFFIASFLLVTYRIAVRVIYHELRNPSRKKSSVIIYGAGEAGIITKRALDRDAGTKYSVLAFVDDNSKKAGKKLEGVSIYESQDLKKLLDENEVKHLIISIQNISTQRKRDIIETVLAYKNTHILNLPPVKTWINGELSFKQIKKVKIEDLLEREPIELDKTSISRELSGKRILVTGASGSIGSEIVRQLIPFKPNKLILLDCAETPLHELELELKDELLYSDAEIIIGDVRNESRMRQIFETHLPEVVFHAAAYKHVPMMELNPAEAILTNVYGTRIVADLSAEFNVEKFVMISTDKAVRPSSMMGASKRIAEIYTQSLSSKGETKFITTRFGNVLGSSGSVIPRFRKQIELGHPVTVTHPDMTRYFMTISEACQLVLEAGAMGKGGEIFIFDMGESVRIAELARKMIRLSGLELDKDISIRYTGLRPGEKLFEELLSDKENTLPTHNQKIMIARIEANDNYQVSKNINELLEMVQSGNGNAIIDKVKEIVPEYQSQEVEAVNR